MTAGTSTRPLGLTGVLTMSALCLISGHLLLKEYMPNAAFGALGFMLVALLLYYVLVQRNDVFGFVMVIYVGSYFSFADNQGGLWNLMTFGMLAGYWAIGRRTEKTPGLDLLAGVLLAVLIFNNVMGWVLKSPVPVVLIGQGAAAFFGFVLMFITLKKIPLTDERVSLFLKVTGVMLVYLIIVALNQRYALVNLNTPLLGAYQKGQGFITYGSTNAQGTFRHSELFGEYAVMMFALLLPLSSSTAAQANLRMRLLYLIVMVFACLAIVLLTSTRSAALLAAAVLAINYAVFILRPIRAINAVRRQVPLAMVIVLAVVVAGAYIGLNSIREDFADLGGEKFSVENVASGKSINRGPLIQFALKRLESDSWWVGHGWGTPRSNLWAWVGYDPETRQTFADYHNLYLSLPMVYGWFGSIAFVALIGYTWLRVSLAAWQYRRTPSPLVVLCFGFAVAWLIFLVDQYKISILRNANYQMLFWIWLALSHALVDTLRSKQSSAAEKVPAPERAPNKPRLVIPAATSANVRHLKGN